MQKCFVIQPFDGNKFDRRYSETFKPAIKKANLEPYRVDQDPSTEIPIEDIQDGIRDCSVVLADITTDNPNVWYEVGFAMAYRKKIVLLCSDERTNKYPFDIQHRSIIQYSTKSKGDFEKLEKEIIKKLKYYLKIITDLVVPDFETDILSESILSDEEIITLGLIGDLAESPDSPVYIFKLKEQMLKAGYRSLGSNIFLEYLHRKGFVDYLKIEDNYDVIPACLITEKGFDWITKNQSRLNLKASSTYTKENNFSTLADDEIPF